MFLTLLSLLGCFKPVVLPPAVELPEDSASTVVEDTASTVPTDDTGIHRPQRDLVSGKPGAVRAHRSYGPAPGRVAVMEARQPVDALCVVGPRPGAVVV